MSAYEDFCGCGDADCPHCFGGATESEKPVTGNAHLDEALRQLREKPVGEGRTNEP